jgi:hypothetical protein
VLRHGNNFTFYIFHNRQNVNASASLCHHLHYHLHYHTLPSAEIMVMLLWKLSVSRISEPCIFYEH